MEFSRIGDDVVLRLDPGDEIHQSIQSLSKYGVDCAIITSGIGRVRDIQIGYLSGNGIYQKLNHEGPMELLSTQGNLAPGPNGPFTHLHTIMSDNEHNVHGGHLYRATIHVVAEIHLRILDSNIMKREPTNTEFVALKFCELE
tara:strand:+ start:7775 stop:8203 length:429 start_codon:yes stop_codon:yes gene_type:complete